MQNRRWVVKGRVQMVGFRWFVRRNAERLCLVGWAKNLSDGSVEVVAWGNPEELDELESAVEEGPMGARVDDVERVQIEGETTPPKSFLTI